MATMTSRHLGNSDIGDTVNIPSTSTSAATNSTSTQGQLCL